MKKCSECKRPLNEDENYLCPACESIKSHKKKKWFVIILGTLFVVILLTLISCGETEESRKETVARINNQIEDNYRSCCSSCKSEQCLNLCHDVRIHDIENLILKYY